MASEGDSSVDFRHEVKCMMYSLGDVKYPSPDSVALLEEIIHTQVAEIVPKAADVTRMRGGRTMSVEDILFLLRKNNDKLRFVLRQMNLKESFKRAKSIEAKDPDEEEKVSSDYFEPPAKKRKYSLNFLTENDQATVGNQELDNPLIQRLEHLDEITKDMDPEDYIFYTRCRRANFNKNTTKFAKWLEVSSLTDMKIGQDQIEIFGFLANMTAQELIELSLLVKEDMENTLLKPHFHHSHHTHTPLCETTPTFITVPDSDTVLPSDPTQSTPPPAPLPPSPSSPLPSAMSLRGHKKKQKASLSLNLTSPLDRPPRPAAVTPPESRALQPRHIHEAVRRFGYMMGPLVPLSTQFPKPTFYKHLFCT